MTIKMNVCICDVVNRHFHIFFYDLRKSLKTTHHQTDIQITIGHIIRAHYNTNKEGNQTKQHFGTYRTYVNKKRKSAIFSAKYFVAYKAYKRYKGYKPQEIF